MAGLRPHFGPADERPKMQYLVLLKHDLHNWWIVAERELLTEAMVIYGEQVAKFGPERVRVARQVAPLAK